jgi:steroid delta-isomerase-like uncharacterized protein
MSIEHHAQLVHQMYAAIDSGNVAAVPGLFGPSWVNHDPSMPPLAGHEGARQLIAILKGAFPDFQTTIDELLVEGDWVAARMTHTATHSGTFMQIPPTGRSATVTATGIFHISNGRIVENRMVFDALGLLRQLGVVPEPGESNPVPL